MNKEEGKGSSVFLIKQSDKAGGRHAVCDNLPGCITADDAPSIKAAQAV